MDNSSNDQKRQDLTQKPKKGILRALVGFAIYLLIIPSLLFISAGILDWPMAWIYSVLLITSTITSRLIVLKKFPDLLYERAKFTQAERTKSQARTTVIVGVLSPIAMMIVAGFDHRFSWSSPIPSWGQWAAAVAIVIGFGLGVWAMGVNRFFSADVRIQKDRGHVVVTSGPYQLVRHPGYVGGLLGIIALPFMLDSMWALVPAVISMPPLISRTIVEDRMLIDELPGYSDYAKQTKFRLIPGVW